MICFHNNYFISSSFTLQGNASAILPKCWQRSTAPSFTHSFFRVLVDSRIRYFFHNHKHSHIYHHHCFQTLCTMGWSDTWNEILSGHNQRWKAVPEDAIEIAMEHIESNYQRPSTDRDSTVTIFCPLAGDDRFLHYAWSKGYIVIGLDFVPQALNSCRKNFDQDGVQWTKNENQSSPFIIWKGSKANENCRITLYQGDLFQIIPELIDQVDVIYDKDSFGALEIESRKLHAYLMQRYLKSGGIIYIEVKFKDDQHPGRHSGPPFHVTKEDLMKPEVFGNDNFHYVQSLGEVYPLNSRPQILQTGHIIRRN